MDTVDTENLSQLSKGKVNFLSYLALPVCLLLCALFTINILHFDYKSELPPNISALSKVHFIANDGIESLSQSGYGTKVVLPHSWPSNYEQHVGWYTSLIPIDGLPERPQAIYFPDISVDSTIFLNDQILGSVLRPDETRGRMGRRPLFLRVPVGLWLEGDNELNIRVNAEPNSYDWLRVFYLGDETVLSDVYAKHVFHSISVVKIIAGLLAFTAVSMGIVWLYRPKDAVYGWFAVVCTAWAGVTLTEVSDALIFDFSLPPWLGSLLFLVLSISMLRFVGETRVPRMQLRHPLLQVATGVFVVALLLYFWRDQPGVYIFVKGVGVVILLFTCVLSVFSKDANALADRVFLWLTLFMLTVLSVYSWLDSLTVPGLAFTGLSTAMAAPAFVFLVGYQLVRDFVTARNDLERLNGHLEQRVLERTAALEEQHKKLLRLERETVLSAERDRIMLEMHDGMGAHLVSILSMADKQHVNALEVKNTVKDALQDLRMMIDSLDPVENDIGLVLGMYRHRMSKILNESSIKLSWQVKDLPLIPDLTPHRVLQILRILQEAVANAIKYADSNSISVSTGMDEQRPFIEIRDYGNGMTPECVGTGRGLHNMQKRARSIGAEIKINSSAQGVVVRLLLTPVGEQTTSRKNTGAQRYAAVA